MEAASGAIVAERLATPVGSVARRGVEQAELVLLDDAAFSWEEGLLTYVGPADGLPPGASEPRVLGPSETVVPGFVDCHTHLPFFGWRDDEHEARLAGRTYRDLHGSGGIPRSARMLADAVDDEVLAFCLPLVAEMADHGTTALELKTGYGLSVEAELRQARLARRLAVAAPQTCTVTLLACHAVPPDADRATWVRTACDELIPAAAAEGLADGVDVYVEDIAFTVENLEAVAGAAEAAGLPFRCHADQLGPSGAAEAAVRVGARSADHLNHASAEGVAALGHGSTVAVLLPASTLLLGADRPPAAGLLEAGAAIALATDCNPGTSPVVSMPEAIALGCALYRLSPATALTAATLNGAHVLGMADRLGSLEVGKRADFLVLDGGVRSVPYRPGHDPVLETFAGGVRVGGRRPPVGAPPTG